MLIIIGGLLIFACFSGCTKREINPEEFYQRGLAYHDKDEDCLAYINHLKATIFDPTNADYFNERGKSLLRIGQTKLAFADFNRAIELKLKNSDVYFGRGNTYLNLGDEYEAIRDYDKAIELDSLNAKALYNRGLCYFYLKEYEKAVVDYQKALVADSMLINAHLNTGVIYRLQKRYKEALTELAAELENYPRCENAFYNIALVNYELGKYQTAVEYFDSALSYCPDHIEALKEKLVALKRISGVSRAVMTDKEVREEIKRRYNPINFANSYYDRGEYQKAIYHYTQIIEDNPNDIVAIANRGLTYWKRGVLDHASKDYRRVLEIDSTYAEAYYGLANIADTRNQFKEALPLLNNAIKYNTYYADAYRLRGAIYRQIGEFEKAEHDFKKAIYHDLHNVDLYFYLGVVYEKMGKKTEAVECYEAFLMLAGKTEIYSQCKDFTLERLTELQKYTPIVIFNL